MTQILRDGTLGASACLGRKDHARARALCEEGLKLSWQLKTKRMVAVYLHVSAALAGARGQPVRSARLWGAAEALREAIGTTFSPVQRYHYGPYIVAARTVLHDESDWAAAWAEGKAMTPEQAVEYALLEEEQAPTSAQVPEESSTDKQASVLTSREEEIAVLVARGLTNRNIASELAISKNTVANHVARVLRKLDLPSRSRIAVWATKQGLRRPE